MIGKVLNGRYELAELLGEGGMALVYKAKDQLLDRWVALKILRPQLVSDKDFVHRFHREAKAVASLSHPNIVNIYDIGQDKDLHFLVMENIQGVNLKEKIKEEGVLSPVEALDIAMQISEALAVAHRNHIIHCDIKPHNILITSEGGVKVTDFGIARAVNSATLAQTETVIGTAHYFSPEQARGGTINARSDLYSLGVVLYEMLTGQVPFRGDSPITVALKHINEEPLPPSQFNENLPKRIDKLVMKALKKDPEDRFHDAFEMLTALRGMMKTFGATKKETAKSYFDNDETQILPRISDQSVAESGGKVQEAVQPVQERSFLERIVKPLIILMLAMVLIGFGSLWALNQYTQVPIVKVPNFVGMSKGQADELARQKGLRVSFGENRLPNPEIPENHVVTQDIPAGNEVKKNRPITLVLSKGAEMTTVPNIIGKEMREVTIALQKADLITGEIEYQYTSKIPKGQVITQSPPANEQVNSGIEVDLVFSKGPEPVKSEIPNLIGLSRQEAEQTLIEANFVVGDIVEVETTRYLGGVVAKQEPQAGTLISEGTPVSLTVSTGLRNPEGLPINDPYQISIPVQSGPYEQQVQVVVIDANGREVIYDQIHHPEDRVYLRNVYTVGPTVIRVYINGQLFQEARIGY